MRPNATLVADIFYTRLFTLDPTLRPLFKGDLAQQGRLLMVMLNSAVSGLPQLDTLAPVVRQLGARHVHYGVREAHYTTVGSALMWTLEQGLGDKFTPEVREAWARTYGLLSSVMLEGAAEAHAGQTAAA